MSSRTWRGTDNFERFMEIFPNRIDAKRCWKIWQGNGKNKPSLEPLGDVIVEAITRQVAAGMISTAKGYRLNPMTWLNNEKWTDEVPETAEERIAKAEAAAARKRAVELAKAERHAEKVAAEKAERDAIWDSLTQERIHQLRQTVLAEMEPWMRRRHDKPEITPLLRLLIVEKHKRPNAKVVT